MQQISSTKAWQYRRVSANGTKAALAISGGGYRLARKSAKAKRRKLKWRLARMKI